MYERWLPFAKVQQHTDKTSPIICPKKFVSIPKNYHVHIDCYGCWTSHDNHAQRLSLAYQSKYEQDNQQRTRNHGVRDCSSWTYGVCLFMLTWALCQSAATASDGCAPGLITAGKTRPAGDIFLEHGQPLRIYCILDENLTHTRYRGKNASDIVFYRNRTLVEPKYVTVVNETTSMLYIDDIPASTDWYFCKLRMDEGYTNEVVCHNKVFIGFKPADPPNFGCISYNWERLVCTWEPAPNYLPTRSSLSFVFPGRAGGSARYHCPVDQARNTCVMDSSTDPIYRLSQSHYYFHLNISNHLGNHISSYVFDHFAHVIPAKPVSLTVDDRTSSSALLQWRLPYPLDSFPSGVHHRIMYRAKLQQSPSWKSVNITSQVRSTHIYFNLTGLEYANTEYEIRVSLKSSLAKGEDMWGQYSEADFKTAPTLPGQAPKADVGSFEIIGNSGRDHRDVYIYWQPIPEHLKNGNDFTYVIEGTDETENRLVQAYKTTETYAKFTGISFNNFKFEITAVNCNGANHSRTIVRVPEQLGMPQKPRPLTKIAFDGGVYELSWNPSSRTDIIDYTIFFCVNKRDRPYQCTGYLDWIHVPTNTSAFNITVPDSEKVYQFAIAANTAQDSSGMAWFSGTTILSDDIGKMQAVRINRIDSNLIEVGWELEYFSRMSTVENINIYHCPIISSYNLTCKSPKISADTGCDLHSTRRIVRNLQPFTTYMINVVVISNNGQEVHSELFYITTLSAAHEPGSRRIPPDTPRYSRVTVLRSMNIATVTTENAFDVNHFSDKPDNSFGKTLDIEASRLRKSDFDHTDCEAKLSSLHQSVSELNDTIGYLTEENNRLNKKLSQYNEVGLTVVESSGNR